MTIGECFSCAKMPLCTETNIHRVLADYTCPVYVPVSAPVYMARQKMVEQYGEAAAIEAMLDRPPTEEQ